MSDYATVNPADTLEISLFDINDRILRDGQLVQIPDWTGTTPHVELTIRGKPEPTLGLYNYTPSAVVCDPPQYYSEDSTLAFRNAADTAPGTVNDPTSQVVEAKQCIEIPVDDLLAEKNNELDAYARFVLVSNCETNLAPNWVILLDTIQTTWIHRVNDFLQDRMRDRVYDADPKSYWTQDVPLRFINKTTGAGLRTNVSETQWGQVMKDIGLHSFAATDAQALCQADIDAAHTADDWAALAAIDVESAAYGWPPVYIP